MSLSSRIHLPPFGLLYFISLASGWSYLEPGGTIDWSSKNNTCDKSFQSPIDIITSEATNKRFPPFHVEHYSTAADGATFVNNGHTVEADLIQSPAPTLSGGGLNGIYTALQFHFHWGSSDNYGSEHFLDGNSFPMEMHIVHYSQKYPNISEALTKKNGLAVLAIFFEVTNCNNTEFQCIIKKLPRIRNAGNITRLYCNLPKLLPKNIDRFYRYSGSLTTPPCSESVVWTVYPEAIKISSWQINQFRSQLSRSYNGDKTILVNNFRSLQSRNNRRIYRSIIDSSATLPRQFNRAVFLLVMILSAANLELFLSPNVI